MRDASRLKSRSQSLDFLFFIFFLFCVTQLVALRRYKNNLDVDLLVIDLSQDQLCKRIPMGRFGTVEEVADAAAFLAQNSYANNCVLTIDGGLSAGFSASP